MKINRFTYLLAALLILSFESQACRMVSIEKSAANYILKMIKNTADIYIAEATTYSKDDESFTFKITEVVRGEKKENLVIGGLFLDSGVTDKTFYEKSLNDFNGHKDSIFWNNIFTGRTTFGTDCRLNHSFQIGSKYLIFSKLPYQAKSFELIKSKKDKWYQFVVETIYPPKKNKKTVAVSSDNSVPAATAAPASPPTIETQPVEIKSQTN